jgi:hypothetical protein
MSPDTPVASVDECFDYLRNNQWQFGMLETQSPVRISAYMLRSLYFHIGCAKFGVPFGDNIEQLGQQLKQLSLEKST